MRLALATFPDEAVMQRLANQYAYAAFQGDLDKPLFANFFDGSNGWCRVGSHGPGYSYGPSDLSEAGITGGYGFWKRWNADIALVNAAIWQMVSSEDEETVAFRDERFGRYWKDFTRTPGGFSVGVGSSLTLLMFLPQLAVDGAPGALP